MTGLVRAIALIACVLAPGVHAQAQPPAHAALIEIDGPIGPATSGYFDKASAQAIEDGASLILLRIDTPGGLDGAMRDIIKNILASPLPVVSYVAPGGARAASAGTYILYASHVAAMAPATNLGAATPVPAMGGGFGDEGEQPAGAPAKPGEESPQTDNPADADAAPAKPKSAMEKKVVNDAVAYIRGLAEQRGRNADWAEEAVREGVSLSSGAALERGVVDLVADNIDDLLAKIDGREIETASGPVQIHSRELIVRTYAPDWRFEFLGVLTNPTVAYILMMIGIYGLLLEGYHPGAIVPGVLGAISLLLALFAFQILPVSYAGLGLLLLGVVLMVAEALAPSFGVLGFGGIAAFVIGSVFLMDTDVPGYQVNLGVIIALALAAAGVLALTLYLLWRARRSPVQTGDPLLIGHTVEVLQFDNGRGWGRVNGERWQLNSDRGLVCGAQARIVSVHGLTLTVEPLETSSPG